jgi:hypothetical protein
MMKKEPLKFKPRQKVRCLPDNELKLIPTPLVVTPTTTHDLEAVPSTYSSLEMAAQAVLNSQSRDIRDPHNSDCEDQGLMGCDTM